MRCIVRTANIMLNMRMIESGITLRILDAAARTPVQWEATDEAEHPYRSDVSGVTWQVRLNDFPAESLYTLLIAAEEIGDFDEWPSGWRRP